ncbi:uncharacterized protein BDZ99DRAFT_274064 [Mytilinidion resinicola]|uniref:Uncharacterized protein n=1 Tax=Mytilinidion resinicola TaxID=574789 RepID=A0A6A6YRE1_9PEZI|nr:uncharacterized protein BDZ99DRAFT_274064 [Mytilinidion resinicola]KAF2811341.1 hypothetical protein BDZ99DRAFT_274064 [Mytilinidion resinicola]
MPRKNFEVELADADHKPRDSMVTTQQIENATLAHLYNAPRCCNTLNYSGFIGEHWVYPGVNGRLSSLVDTYRLGACSRRSSISASSTATQAERMASCQAAHLTTWSIFCPSSRIWQRSPWSSPEMSRNSSVAIMGRCRWCSLATCSCSSRWTRRTRTQISRGGDQES